ncbi:uncharacterized protein LOC126978372 [Leptidea sinapis]|uniref:uncharacterized protein LOC126978372 n=1 Tax=Leptidea sinapis TaxID=189913 RepID=UPI002129D77A|nr:uncharacterized protein LOC126978372 [Leptidea sinapis]
MPHKCAFGCKATDVVMHVFPNPEKYSERFRVWVNLVGKNLAMLSDKKIYKLKRICDIHFAKEHRNRYKRLNVLAVPSLHLPSTSRMQLSETATHTQPSTSVPITPGIPEIIELDSDDTLPEAPLPSTSASGASHSTSAHAEVLVDHNYSAISRPRPKKTYKGASRTKFFRNDSIRQLQIKIKSLENEVQRLRKKTHLFKERLGKAKRFLNRKQCI